MENPDPSDIREVDDSKIFFDVRYEFNGTVREDVSYNVFLS